MVENAAQAFKFDCHTINSEDGGGDENDEGSWWLYSSTWMILSRNKEFMNKSTLRHASVPATGNEPKVPLWTDDYTSMFKILQ